MIHLNWMDVYEHVKFWLPVSTAAGLLYRWYANLKRGVSKWADTLLDNHMVHIQSASEKASEAVVELAGYHKEMLDSQQKLVVALTDMQSDVHEHFSEDRKITAQVATGIEVIKAKLDMQRHGVF
jgi:hypothetical protein